MKSTCDNRYSDAPHSCICTPSSPSILLAVHLVALYWYGICPNYRMNIAGSLMPGVNTRDQLRTMRSQLYPYRRDTTVVPPNYMMSENASYRLESEQWAPTATHKLIYPRRVAFHGGSESIPHQNVS